MWAKHMQAWDTDSAKHFRQCNKTFGQQVRQQR